jgi:glyoxylase-like metal-dependent hydrolase (beta-lactamase superfamily II)
MQGPVEIVRGVHGLGSRFVNWFVVEDEGRLTAVDAGLPGFRGDLTGDLEALGHRLEDVDAVVLTHSDADHTGVTPALREAGARVLIHAEDEDTLRRPRPKGGDASPIHLVPHLWRPSLWRVGVHMTRAGGARPPKIEGAETFSDGDLLDVPGRPRVVHTPGHTPGHCVLLFERHGALFVGDAMCTWNLLTGRRGPQVMPSAFNVSTDDCFESLAAIEALEAQALLPGHGDPWRESPAAAVARAREAGRS